MAEPMLRHVDVDGIVHGTKQALRYWGETSWCGIDTTGTIEGATWSADVVTCLKCLAIGEQGSVTGGLDA